MVFAYSQKRAVNLLGKKARMTFYVFLPIRNVDFVSCGYS